MTSNDIQWGLVLHQLHLLTSHSPVTFRFLHHLISHSPITSFLFCTSSYRIPPEPHIAFPQNLISHSPSTSYLIPPEPHATWSHQADELFFRDGPFVFARPHIPLLITPQYLIPHGVIRPIAAAGYHQIHLYITQDTQTHKHRERQTHRERDTHSQ